MLDRFPANPRPTGLVADPTTSAFAATAPPTTPDRSLLRAVYRNMLRARAVDATEVDLVARGEAFFHIPCGGHEAMAALDPHLTSDDWLHLHYRDKALLLARGLPPVEFFHNLLCTADSQSAGRQMNPFM